MSTTMIATVKGMRDFIIVQISSECQKHWCSVKLLMILGIHIFAAYVSPRLLIVDILGHAVFICLVYKLWVENMGSENKMYCRSDCRFFSFRPRPRTAQVCISLYMYHRFIFHAHWSARTRGLDRWLWDLVRAIISLSQMQYVCGFLRACA